MTIYTSGNFLEENFNFEEKKNILDFLKEKLKNDQKSKNEIFKEKCQKSKNEIFEVENEEKNNIKKIFQEISKYPISLFIICLNPENYDKMTIISDKGGEFRKYGIKRNFVNFIPFNDLEWNVDVLERELLRYLPEQVIEFYHENVLNKIE